MNEYLVNTPGNRVRTVDIDFMTLPVNKRACYFLKKSFKKNRLGVSVVPPGIVSVSQIGVGHERV